MDWEKYIGAFANDLDHADMEELRSERTIQQTIKVIYLHFAGIYFFYTHSYL